MKASVKLKSVVRGILFSSLLATLPAHQNAYGIILGKWIYVDAGAGGTVSEDSENAALAAIILGSLALGLGCCAGSTAAGKKEAGGGCGILAALATLGTIIVAGEESQGFTLAQTAFYPMTEEERERLEKSLDSMNLLNGELDVIRAHYLDAIQQGHDAKTCVSNLKRQLGEDIGQTFVELISLRANPNS